MTKFYLVKTGIAEEIDHVLGPYVNQQSARVGKRTAEQMQFRDTTETYASGGDTWVKIEERELIV